MTESAMIDLETLGTNPDCVIMTIAAVAFNPSTYEITRTFSENIEFGYQTRIGRKIEPETLNWWFLQSKEVQQMVASNVKRLNIVLADFFEWVAPCSEIWANGIDFDLAVLRNAYGGEMPWEYWDQRDLRTVAKIAGVDPRKIPFKGVKHNAVDDCKHQIKVLEESYKKLGLI